MSIEIRRHEGFAELVVEAQGTEGLGLQFSSSVQLHVADEVARLKRENTDLHELVDHWRQRALKAEGEASA